MSRDCRAKVARPSRDIFSKLDRNSRICRINVYSMRLQRESCVYIVYLCREIVANYSRTSLQLSHSSEIGAQMVLCTCLFDLRLYVPVNICVYVWPPFFFGFCPTLRYHGTHKCASKITTQVNKCEIRYCVYVYKTQISESSYTILKSLKISKYSEYN